MYTRHHVVECRVPFSNTALSRAASTPSKLRRRGQSPITLYLKTREVLCDAQCPPLLILVAGAPINHKNPAWLWFGDIAPPKNIFRAMKHRRWSSHHNVNVFRKHQTFILMMNSEQFRVLTLVGFIAYQWETDYITDHVCTVRHKYLLECCRTLSLSPSVPSGEYFRRGPVWWLVSWHISRRDN